MTTELKYDVFAIFPKNKIINYKQAITYQTFLENESIPNVIKYFGILPCYLDKLVLKIHPRDILVCSDLNSVIDTRFKELFSDKNIKELYVIKFNISYSQLYIPLTSIFHSRFNTFAMEWLNNYLMTLCDTPITEQNFISLKDMCFIQQIIDDNEIKTLCDHIIKKYIPLKYGDFSKMSKEMGVTHTHAKRLFEKYYPFLVK